MMKDNIMVLLRVTGTFFNCLIILMLLFMLNCSFNYSDYVWDS